MSARVPPRRRRLASGPSPLNDAEAGNIAAKGELSARENRVWMPVRRIVQAQLSRGSNFVAMLGRDPHIHRRWDRRDQWSSTFSNCTARAALFSHSPSSRWRRARLSGRSAIELPPEFLTTIFGAVVIVANVRQLRNRLRASPDAHERS